MDLCLCLQEVLETQNRFSSLMCMCLTTAATLGCWPSRAPIITLYWILEGCWWLWNTPAPLSIRSSGFSLEQRMVLICFQITVRVKASFCLIAPVPKIFDRRGSVLAHVQLHQRPVPLQQHGQRARLPLHERQPVGLQERLHQVGGDHRGLQEAFHQRLCVFGSVEVQTVCCNWR